MRTFLAIITALLFACPLHAQPLKKPADLAHIETDAARAAAMFSEAAKVFQHARCANCHPATERPLQTDRSKPHIPVVSRGPEGFGNAGLRCQSCHQALNSATGVPGAPHWHLAPVSMSLVAKSAAEICMQVKDRSQNGDRSIGVISQHVAWDPLIQWAWAPGGGREAPPGTHQTFVALMSAWAAAGAACPTE
ncbi:MAG: Isoquinoline 1-oxidoreductase subunit [Pseudomonadota bacterium]